MTQKYMTYSDLYTNPDIRIYFRNQHNRIETKQTVYEITYRFKIHADPIRFWNRFQLESKGIIGVPLRYGKWKGFFTLEIFYVYKNIWFEKSAMENFQ